MQEVPQKGRPSKKLCYITSKGREELQAWLMQPTAADQIRREFLLKLYLASHVTAQELVMLLAMRRGETEAALTNLHAKRDAANDPQRAWVINYELSLCKAEIDWLDQIETQIVAD